MNLTNLIFPACLLVTLTSTLLLVTRNWHWSVSILAVQYIGIFILTSASWPLETAIVKMVAGWMAGAVLGMATATVPDTWQNIEMFSPSGRLFRLIAAAMVGITVYSFISPVTKLVPQLSPSLAWGGLILISIGLLQLGLTSQPLRVAIGLLTLLSGFEIIYAAVESSTLVAGLLAGVNLCVALAGAYLLIAPSMEEAE